MGLLIHSALLLLTCPDASLTTEILFNGLAAAIARSQLIPPAISPFLQDTLFAPIFFRLPSLV